MAEIIFHLPVLVFALIRKTLVLKITLGFPITTQSQLFGSQLPFLTSFSFHPLKHCPSNVFCYGIL